MSPARLVYPDNRYKQIFSCYLFLILCFLGWSVEGSVEIVHGQVVRQSMDPVRRRVHGPGVSVFGSPVQKWLIVFKNLLIMLEILTGDVRKTKTRSQFSCLFQCLFAFLSIFSRNRQCVAALVTLALMEAGCPGYLGTSTVTTQPMAGKS